MSSYAYAGVITHRWAPQILLALKDGPCRFNTLLNGIEGISDRVLSERFRDLEERGLISREVLAGPPVRVYYGLTVSGRRYIEPLEQVAAVDAALAERVQEVAVG